MPFMAGNVDMHAHFTVWHLGSRIPHKHSLDFWKKINRKNCELLLVRSVKGRSSLPPPTTFIVFSFSAMAGGVKRGSRPPWVGLAAAVWVQVASGSGYTFALYSPSLKSVLGFSQQQLTMLGVANDIGENFGLLPGVVCNRLPPWAILLVATLTSFLGFGVLWLALTQTLPSLPYWVLWVALCVATNSTAWMGTGVLVTNMRNFPLSRGAVAGILKGYVGLSGAVFTLIFTGALGNSSTNLLLLLTLGVPIVCLSMMYFVRPCTPSLEDDSTEHGHFLFVQISSFILGLYLLLTTILNEVYPVVDVISYIFVGIMILIILSPLAIPVKMTLYPTKTKQPVVSDSSSSSENNSSGDVKDTEEPLLVSSSSTPMLGSFMENDESGDIDMLLAEGEGAVKKRRRPRRGEDFKFHEAIVKADFWLLFMAYFLAVGSGVTVLNNLAQIAVAAGIDQTNILLSLFSFFNFIGRLVGGVVSEQFVRSNMLPRPFWMICTQLLMVLVYLLFAFAPSSVLYVSSGLLGICYGVQFSIMVPTASELFGLKHFGIIYNFMLLGNPLGAVLFSGFLAGYVYDTEAAKQHGEPNDTSSSCLGPDCFRLTFEVLAAVCVLGSILSTILTVRLRPVYQTLYSSGSFRLPRSSDH